MATRSPRGSGSDRPDRQDPGKLLAEIERLQARLDEAEQRNRDLLQGSLQGVMVHRDNRLIFANQAFADMFGYPDADAVVAMGDWQQCQALGERSRMEAFRVARMAGHAAPTRYVFEGRRADGAPIWVENVVRLIKWDGQPAILSSMLDITDRRRMETDLRLSEERFRTAFEGAPLGIAVARPGKGFIQVNDEYCEFLGRSREEMINHPDPIELVRQISHPDDFEADMAHFAQLLDGRIDSYQMEKRYLRPNGEVRWGLLAVSASRDANGKARYLIAHLIDITERKAAEAALRESEERFRVAFEQSPLGLALGSPAEGWHQTNRAFQEFLSLPPDDPVFKQDLEQQLSAYSEPEDAVEHLRLHRELVAGQRDSFELEKRYRRPDGRYKWGSLHVAATRNPDRSIKWLVSQRLDITAQKAAEQALRESEERFRVAFEDAPVALAVGEFNEHTVQANAAMCEFLGRPREWFASSADRMRIVSEIIHPDDIPGEMAAFERMRLSGGNAYSTERRYLRPNGEVRWGSGTISVTRGPDGRIRFVIVQITDITERKLTEEALRESEERFRATFEQAPVGLAIWEYNSGGVQANAAICEFLGWPREWFLANRDRRALLDVIGHPDDSPTAYAGFDEVRRGARDSFRLEMRCRHASGKTLWGDVSVTVTRWPDQRVRYVILQVTDITPRKQMEAALKRSEERFRAAFERAPVGMNLAVPNGPYIQVNRAFADFLGRTPEQLLGIPTHAQAIRDVSHPDDVAATQEGVRKLIRGELETFQLEKRYLTPTGEVRWGVLSATLAHTPEGAPDYLITQVVDITPRKQAEEALRESEERFRIAFENAPIGIALGLAGQGWIQVNPAMVAFLGRNAQELMALKDPVKLISTISHPEDVKESLALLKDLAEGKITAYSHEKRYLRPNGEVRWGHHSASGSRHADGTLHYTISLVSDVSALKQTQAALQESEERFRIAFDYAPLGISVAVPGRGWVQMNAAMERFLGRPPSALMGRADQLQLIREISHPDDFEANAVLFNRMMAGEIDHYQMEKRYVLPTGEVRWGYLNVATSRDPTGAIRYTVSQIADITALKQTEQALRDREATLAAAQQITHLGSWRLEIPETGDEASQKLDWSDEVFRILGHPPGAFTPTRQILRDHVHPDDRKRLIEAWDMALATHRPYSVEHRIIKPDGAERLVTQQSEIFYDERTGRPVLARGTIQDVTEQKELERKLLQSQKLESLGLLAGGIAHDFNNLLTGILGYASLARETLAPASPLHEFIGQIELGGRRAAELCQQMLAYAGRGRFDVRANAVNDIVMDTLPLLEVSIPKKIALTLNLAESLPTVEVDATQIRQIVMNLITNAADAIGAKEGRISLTTGAIHAGRDYLAQTYLAPALPEGQYVYLEVSDTGEGMSPEVQKKIFDPFFTTKFAGRGLGLAAVLGIVRAHHGALRVYSEPGQGTTMRLLLPAALGLPDLRPAGSSARWRGQGVALVVDDEPTVREVALRLLQALGFSTLSAANGQEALEIYRGKSGGIHLVLLDLTMPLMDGEETFRAIRAIDPAATVVLMSGFTEQESLDRFAGTGLAAFLQKPFTLQALKEVLQRIFP